MSRRFRSRLTGSLLAGVLAGLTMAPLALAAPPDSSGAVSRYSDVFAVAYLDEKDGLWALGGPPPEEGCFGLGFDDPADIAEVQTPAGPLKVWVRQGETPVHVYDATPGHPCEVIEAGGSPVPLYVGYMSTIGNDNDLFVTFSRTNSFGFSSTGWVWDGEGNACRFSAHVRLLITRDDEFRVASEGITIAC